MANDVLAKALTPEIPGLSKGGKQLISAQKPFLESKQQLSTELADTEKRILEGQQSQKEAEAQGAVAAGEKYVQGRTAAQEKMQTQLAEAPIEPFIPTKDTAQDIAGLFSVIGVLGMLAGRSNAQQAMGAMNGMLEGHRKGRADLYKQERDTYEKNFKALIKKHEELRNEFKDAMETLATDKELGMQKAHLAAVKSGSSIIQELVNKGRIVEAAKIVNEAQQGITKAIETSIQEFQHAEDMAARERQHRETMAAKTTAPSDTASDVKNFLGVDFGKGKSAETKNDQVAGAANAMAEAMALSNFVRKTPEVVGRVGQAKSIIDKYVGSLDSSGIETDKTPKPQNQQEQEALLFAKRYAAYLIRYEQALAGSAKGFTVAFMKRFNDLMQSNQFNPEGFDNLMKEQIRELSARSSALSTKITEDNMMRLGIAQTRDPDALETYSRIKGQAAPAPGASNLDKERTKANAAIQRGASEEAVKQRFKQTTGQEL